MPDARRSARPRPPGATVADTLVATLEAHGVDRVFCLPGESYLPVLDRLATRPRIDVVVCRHEASAGFAAMADAKLTGRAGVCMVSRAPGATNAAIAVHAAAEDATPLVLLVGHVPTSEIGRKAFQELDCEQTFGAITKATWTLRDPARTGELVALAFRTAESGTRGPVVLVLPEDVLALSDPSGRPVAPWRHTAVAPAGSDVATVATMVASAARPLLIAGGELDDDRGRAALAAVSIRHEIPVATSNKRQHLFDNRHPHFAGHLHNSVPSAQRAALARADLVLAVGTRLDGVTTARHRWPVSPVADQPLVHVCSDPAQLGVAYRPTLGLAADPTRFLEALATVAAAPTPAVLDERRAWIGELHGIEVSKSVWRQLDSADGVPFGAVVAALDELTRGDVVVAVDSGTFTSWVYRHLRLTGAGRLVGAGASPMGFGVPAGVAAALRLRRPAVVVVGDGGFLMTGSELATAVARRLPLVVVVADNRSYGTIRLHQERAYPGRPFATDLVNPDFAKLAEAYGALGLAVDDDVDVLPALARALDCGGPAVVSVRTSLSFITANERLDGVAAAGRAPAGEPVRSPR